MVSVWQRLSWSPLYRLEWLERWFRNSEAESKKKKSSPCFCRFRMRAHVCRSVFTLGTLTRRYQATAKHTNVHKPLSVSTTFHWVGPDRCSAIRSHCSLFRLFLSFGAWLQTTRASEHTLADARAHALYRGRRETLGARPCQCSAAHRVGTDPRGLSRQQTPLKNIADVSVIFHSIL